MLVLRSILWQDKDPLRSAVVGYSEVGDQAIIVAKTRHVHAVEVKQNFSTEAFLKDMINEPTCTERSAMI